MNLAMDANLAKGFTSSTQIARVTTEDWGARELYCAACTSNSLTQAPNNAKAIDFVCPQCQAEYQLKSAKKWKTDRITDAGYEAMMAKIKKDETPHLLFLHYNAHYRVENLILIPSFFFVASSVEKRKPLGPTARRAGWVGCNILLSAIADEGKLPLVQGGIAHPSQDVRDHYKKVTPIANLPVNLRGWALDVFACIQKLNKKDFALKDVYAFEDHLSRLHPDNQNIRPKIRQQMQVLRDAGLVQFVADGQYHLNL